MHDQVVPINAQGDGKRVFERREILIELSEQPEMVGEGA